jgi:uncharacterized tellurite resistance protein B-like protein
MIASIKEFFSQFIEPGTHRANADADQTLQTATAALLLEMMRMDSHITPEERDSVVATLRQQFGLDDTQLDALVALAEQEARQASDYYQFTSLINKSCSAEQKIRIIENMWRVAMADGHLDAHENHLMRKIAGLLYIPHSEYIAAKLRARQATGLAAE